MKLIVGLFSIICLAISICLLVIIVPDISDTIKVIQIAFKVDWKVGIQTAVAVFGNIILFFSIGIIGLLGGRRKKSDD